MKRFTAIVLVLVLALTMGACSLEEETPAGTTEKKSVLDVEKGFRDVTITIPASFYESDTDPDSIKADAQEKGYKSCTVNPDGSVTLVIPKNLYKQTLEEMRNDCVKSFNDLTESDAYPSFVGVEYDKNFRNIKVLVDGNEFSEWDTISAMGFYLTSAYYQIFAGVDEDEIDVYVSYVDQSTGEVLDESTYKQWLENIEKSDTEATEKADLEKSDADKVQEVYSWIVGDLWNDGICPMSHYYEDGTGVLGETMDPAFTVSRLKKAYRKRGEYDAAMRSLPDTYADLKTYYGKVIEQVEALYRIIVAQGTRQTGERLDTGLYNQYFDAFRDEYYEKIQ